MYTPPMFKPDRAASLAFAEARGFGTVCAWDGSKPVASSLPFYLNSCRRRHAAGGVSRRAPQCAGGPCRRDVVLADGRERRRRLCFARLVRVAGSGADLALSGRASHRSVRKLSDDELGRHLDALSAKFESWLAPKPPWTVVEDDGRPAGSDEEGDRGPGHDGRGGRRQLQAQPAQIRCRLRRRSPMRWRSRAMQGAQAIAEQMVALRPQLNYISPLNASEPADGRNAP